MQAAWQRVVISTFRIRGCGWSNAGGIEKPGRWRKYNFIHDERRFMNVGSYFHKTEWGRERLWPSKWSKRLVDFIVIDERELDIGYISVWW
jgi:hypothetical protein